MTVKFIGWEGDDARANAKRLEEARARYGKPFAHEVKVERMAPRSARLRALDRLSAQKEAKAAKREELGQNVTVFRRVT
jgi:hypothetical protein